MKLIIAEGKTGLYGAEIACARINKAGGKFVLGLPTGRTSMAMYGALAQKYKAAAVDFAGVTAFNLDEYIGLGAGDKDSYHYFMQSNFFDFVNIAPHNINIPDGMAADLAAECRRYEDKIAAAGGIDLLFGGVGENGHIAFNEPGSPKGGRTRVADLAPSTIKANETLFEDKTKIPHQAITMGLGTIYDAREIVIMAEGPKKAAAVKAAFEGESALWPISYLYSHKAVTLIADKEACALLTPEIIERHK